MKLRTLILAAAVLTIAPAVAHADPITAALTTVFTTIGFSAATAAAAATFVTTQIVTGAVPFSRRHITGRRSGQAGREQPR